MSESYAGKINRKLLKKRRIINAAAGREPSDLVLKNATYVNVFSNELCHADIAVAEGLIVGMGQYSGTVEEDCTGKIVLPGFLDAHIHLESSLVSPKEFVKAVLPHGTTTVITDPHEIANVMGTDGIEYMLQATEGLPVDVRFMLPSCVPATEFDDSGARLEAKDLLRLSEDSAVLGLGEMMNVAGVCDGDAGVFAKLNAFQDKIVDGHAPGLVGKDLQAYLLAGIATDHECSEPEEALEQLRSGMNLMVRRGSGAKNGEVLISTLLDSHISTGRVCFCTDDKHVEDIRREGHISSNIREAIHLGMAPEEAYCMASYHAARMYRLPHLGAVGPGYQADLVVLSDPEEVSVTAVYWRGRLVSGQGIKPLAEKKPVPGFLLDTVHIQPVGREQLRLSCPHGTAHVAQVVPGQILTRHKVCRVPCAHGEFKADQQFQKVAVVERHHGSGKVGVGVAEGFHLHGAIASTVSHDSHNLIVVGDNDLDMLLAIQALEKAKGGYCLTQNGKILEALPLPVCGLISEENTEQVQQVLRDMKRLCLLMGMDEDMDPFQTLSFLSLPVLPEIRITDRGIFDAVESRYL